MIEFHQNLGLFILSLALHLILFFFLTHKIRKIDCKICETRCNVGKNEYRISQIDERITRQRTKIDQVYKLFLQNIGGKVR